MSILPGHKIRELGQTYTSIRITATEMADVVHRPIIEPFQEKFIVNGMSAGLSHAGYDVQLGKDMWLWPFWMRLNFTLQKFNMPRDVVGYVKDKSTNARRAIFVQNTVIEPGWRGNLTLELTRFLPWPVKLKKGHPIAQIIFHRTEEPVEIEYSGKYQDQAAEAVPARREGP